MAILSYTENVRTAWYTGDLVKKREGGGLKGSQKNMGLFL